MLPLRIGEEHWGHGLFAGLEEWTDPLVLCNLGECVRCCRWCLEMGDWMGLLLLYTRGEQVR